MKTFRLFSIAALALAMAACSSEENTLETQSPAAPGKLHFTATIAAPGSGAGTRTTYTEVTSGDNAGTIDVAWKANDEIAIVNGTNKDKVTVGTVATDGTATISGDITAGNNNDDITAYYPYASQEDGFSAKFQAQDGTLAYIQNNLDYRIGQSKLSVSGSQATLNSALTLSSKIAIWKLTLKDNAATPAAISATKVTIKKGDDVIAATSTLGTAKSEVYLAVLLTSDIANANIKIEATVGSDTYTYSKEGVSLAAGKYYQSTVTMAKAVAVGKTLAESTVGMIVGSDGKAYAAADKDNLPENVTAVAMVAYKGTASDCANGLAIALADESSKKTYSAAGPACSGKTAVTGGTWRLPSEKDWQYMAIGCGSGESYVTPGNSVQRDFSKLASKLSTAGGTALTGTHWTSTEYSAGYNAWEMDFDYTPAKFYGESEAAELLVRACLAF